MNVNAILNKAALDITRVLGECARVFPCDCRDYEVRVTERRELVKSFDFDNSVAIESTRITLTFAACEAEGECLPEVGDYVVWHKLRYKLASKATRIGAYVEMRVTEADCAIDGRDDVVEVA